MSITISESDKKPIIVSYDPERDEELDVILKLRQLQPNQLLIVRLAEQSSINARTKCKTCGGNHLSV